MSRKNKGSASPAVTNDTPVANSSTSVASTESLAELKKSLRTYRKNLSVYSKPIDTLYYFVCEILALIFRLLHWLVDNIGKVFLVLGSLAGLLVGGYFASLEFDPDFSIAQSIAKEGYHIAFWVFLGFLSSFGMGTGLHTFVMFLGPMIAAFTVAAYKCKSTVLKGFDYADPDTWKNIKCMEERGDEHAEMTIMQVINTVRWSAMLWGLGTAIGELPPYFMARAARESAEAPDDEDLQEFHESLKDEGQQLSSRLKRQIHNLVQRAGFLGILLCASIPNPLFDLAGLACGHFGISFWTFAGATAIGKGVIKVHLQVFFVVVLTSKPVFAHLLDFVSKLPAVGEFLVMELTKARANMTESFAHHEQEKPFSVIGFLFQAFVVVMLLFFALSIVDHLAQRNRHRRDNALIEQKSKSS